MASAVVRAIIGLCSSLGITCTAQGVETDDQLAALTDENGVEAQGYLFSPPVAACDIPGVLQKLHSCTGVIFTKRPQVSLAGIQYSQIAETANDIVIVTTPNLDPPGPLILYDENMAFEAADRV